MARSLATRGSFVGDGCSQRENSKCVVQIAGPLFLPERNPIEDALLLSIIETIQEGQRYAGLQIATSADRTSLSLKSHFIVVAWTALSNEASVATLQQFGQSWGLYEPGSRQKSLKFPTLISYSHTVQLN